MKINCGSAGNISSLKRYNGNRLIDDLEYHYNEDGNQLRKVTDQGEDADLYRTIEYHNTETQADTTMFYDAMLMILLNLMKRSKKRNKRKDMIPYQR